MIPVIVGGGVLQAIAKMMGGYDIGSHMDQIDTLAKVIMLIGQSLMGFTVPAIAAFIAYAMADKPGIAPGLAMGALANTMNTGFVGGLIGGILVGYLAMYAKKINVPKALSGIMPIMVIPTFVTLIGGLLMFYIFGVPIKWFMSVLTGFLNSLNGGSKFLFGAVIGAMICADHGGPINKTAALFVNGLNADGFLIPTSAKMCAGMTAPLGIALATFLGSKKEIQRRRERAGQVPGYLILLLRSGRRYPVPDQRSGKSVRFLYDRRSYHRRIMYDVGTAVPGCSRRRICNRHDLQPAVIYRPLAVRRMYHRRPLRDSEKTAPGGLCGRRYQQSIIFINIKGEGVSDMGALLPN